MDTWWRRLYNHAQADRPWLIVPESSTTSADASRYSFRDLVRGAESAGSALRLAGGEPGERVVISLENGPDFAWAFFGAWFAGMIPVPVPTHNKFQPRAQYADGMLRTIRHCGARFVVCGSEVEIAGSARVMSPEELLRGPATFVKPAPTDGDETALIQYTSGTTSTPRGVELRHSNLLDNIAGIASSLEYTASGDVIGCWLPLFHDMGLVGCLLEAAYVGCPLVLLKPQSFIMQPESWLWAISRFGVTASPAPNFAYRLCVDRIRDSALVGLDLSTLRLALNGAEAVDYDTVVAFQNRFASFGLSDTAMTPVYGMAESAVACTFSDARGLAFFDTICTTSLRDGRAVPASGEANSRKLASVGHPLPGHSVRIVDPQGQLAPERTVGEVQIKSGSTMRSYFADAAATAAAFTSDGWLRTGDAGYLAHGGQLFITGRVKERIKRNGQAFDATEIAAVVAHVEGVRGRVAVFGVPNLARGTEDLVIVAEAEVDSASGHQLLASDIRSALNRAMGLLPDAVRCVPRGQIPRTTSGKVQNFAAREAYLSHWK